jgi:hypothetical protein
MLNAVEIVCIYIYIYTYTYLNLNHNVFLNMLPFQYI